MKVAVETYDEAATLRADGSAVPRGTDEDPPRSRLVRAVGDDAGHRTIPLALNAPLVSINRRPGEETEIGARALRPQRDAR